MKLKLVAVSLSMAVGAAFTLDAAAQAKPETLVKQRQAAITPPWFSATRAFSKP
jgi:hypothetical protein